MSAETTVSEEDINQARASLVHYGERMAADRLAVRRAGNLAIRLRDIVVMTPTCGHYDPIVERNICVLDTEGVLLDGEGARSSEWPMHRKIYDLTGAGAVVHTHSPVAVALSTVCDEIPAVHYSVLRLGGPTVRVAPYTTFGSGGLADAASAALDGRFAALLQNHGAVAYGASIEEAYDRALLLEWLAEVYWRARLAGSPPIPSDAQIHPARRGGRQHP